MTEADRPGEATSRKRSRLQEELAELERVLDGIELDPERKSMLRAAGYRTCIGIAWQAGRKEPPLPLPQSLPQAALAQPALSNPPMQPPAQPLPPPPLAAPSMPSNPPMPSPPPLGGGEGQPREAAGAWAQQLAERLSKKGLRPEEYSALCKLMQLQKGQYPSPDDCLLLTEIEAYNIACAQPRPCAQPRRRWR